MKYLVDPNELFKVDLPAATDSYSPVSHELYVGMIKKELSRNKLEILAERYTSNDTLSQMFGVYELGTKGSEKTGTLLNVGFRNSYDKKLSVGLVAGATVIVCSNLMFKGEIHVARRHTPGVHDEIEEMISSGISLALPNYGDIQEDIKRWKSQLLSKKQMAELAGRLFIDEDLISSEQLRLIKNEIHCSKLFTGETTWDFYNHVTEALKLSLPKDVMPRHTRLHKFMEEIVC